ncbi:hypothetical protein BG006_000313 [Podila minutissima]|uniref:PH domain-containing protein n=1 Tax=Podila minutissima TaxID=64525 RepID=A0A9P5VHV6_9FUNG|nr:hypothetical protein BG006_000313 [Podila minutissima]
MPPKGDCLAQWDPRQTSDTTPARPLYSGHLLKLGSNDRWQSRLFTFDGSVLICVGKRPRAPVIMTYDPYVSSPFMSPSCNPHPMNPNTKWFINIASVTDIKLLPSSKSFRCFPYSDGSRALSIRTSDGRHLMLRANKDTELERWYFVLFKIWEFQQQLIKAEESQPQLAAHQQSAQLFQKYLQKQYHQPKDQHDQEFSTLPPTQTQTQHVQILQPPKMLRPPLNRPRESLLRYQIPAPARVSTFLPQGFDWSVQEGDEDDLPAELSSYDSPSLSGERHPQTRHASHSHTASSMGNRELTRSASAGMVPQRFGVPAASSMEPSKAAIIDHWRRSLMSPLLLEEASGPGDQETPENGTKDANAEGDDDDEPLVAEHPRTDSRDMESTLRHNSHEFEDGVDSKRFSKWRIENDPPNGSDDDTPIATNLYSRLPHGRGRSYIGHQRSSFLPGMAVQEEEEEETPVVVKLREALDSTVQQLAVRDNSKERGEEDEMPLGLLHVNRHSRWLNTQLSSEDGASAVNLDSHIEDRLPSEPMPQTKSRDSAEVRLSDPDLDLDRLTPPHSNPSLSLHGSSYSHLPIHDPEFVFPHAAFDPSVTLVNTPTSLQFETTNSPSIPPPMRPPRPSLSVDLAAFSNNTTSVTLISPPKGHLSPSMAMHKTKEDPTPHRSFSSSNKPIHPHAPMPGLKSVRPMGDKNNNRHQRNDGDGDDDEEPLVHTLSRQQSQRKHKIQMHIQVPPLNSNINHNHNAAKDGHDSTLRDQATPPHSDESFQYF